MKKCIQYNKKGCLNLEFTVVEEKSLPVAEALYIIDFDELFSQDLHPIEILSVYKAIERLSLKFKAVFIQIQDMANIECCIQAIAKINKNSPLISFLRTQEENDFDFENFVESCRELKIKNVYLGGVFGNACVFEAGRRYAKNIYSKVLPIFHPNVRFYPKEINFTFENAIILPEISEGHCRYSELAKPFDQYLCFPPLAVFDVSFGEQFPITDRLTAEVNEIEQKNPRAGADYHDILGTVDEKYDHPIYNFIFKLTQNKSALTTEKIDFWRLEKIRILKLKMGMMLMSLGKDLFQGVYLLAMKELQIKLKYQCEIKNNFVPLRLMKNLITQMSMAKMSHSDIETAFRESCASFAI